MLDLHQPPQSLVPETPPWETPLLVPDPVNFDVDMLLQLNFTNPNKKLSVMFEKVSVELWFADEMIATQGVLPFSLSNGKTRL